MGTTKYLLSVILAISSLFSFGQDILIETIPAPVDGDTINLCQDTLVTLEVFQPNGEHFPDGTRFFWFYGDGITQSGQNVDSVTHYYEDGGGYYLRLRVETIEQDTIYAVQPIRVARTPYFEGTKSDIGEKSMCYSESDVDQVMLTGSVQANSWMYIYPIRKSEDKPLEVSNGKPYFSSITQEAYHAEHRITSSADIDSVSIRIEHSNSGHLEFRLTCPSGQSVQLKQSGGSKTFLGEPVDNENMDTLAGTPFRYYFTEKSPEYATMQKEESTYQYNYTDNADSTYIDEYYLPASSYRPSGSFEKLVGCPINGDWTLSVVDADIEDNGYVFDWELHLDTIPYKWSFTNNYTTHGWSAATGGEIITGNSSQIAIGQPTMGNLGVKYIYTVTDNFGCQFDTSLIIPVTGSTFEVDPLTADAPAEITFTSTTSWDTAYVNWDFGDGNSAGNESPITHTYEEKGEYLVTYTATSDYNCENTDTLRIVITAPVSSYDAPNVFTPNGDLLNDLFIIKHEGMRDIRVFIYSRWGRKLCELNNMEAVDAGWDGTIRNNGNRYAPPGIYFYQIIAEGLDDKKYNEGGTLHLFRN